MGDCILMLVPGLLVDVRVGLEGSVTVDTREKAIEHDETAQRASRLGTGHVVNRSKEQKTPGLEFCGQVEEMLGSILVPEVGHNDLVAVQLGPEVAVVCLPEGHRVAPLVQKLLFCLPRGKVVLTELVQGSLQLLIPGGIQL